MIDWSLADFILSLVAYGSMAPMGYLLWASGYLRFLVSAARDNGWGFGSKKKEEWVKEW